MKIVAIICMAIICMLLLCFIILGFIEEWKRKKAWQDIKSHLNGPYYCDEFKKPCLYDRDRVDIRGCCGCERLKGTKI